MAAKKKNKSVKWWKKIAISLIIILLLSAMLTTYNFYRKIHAPVINVSRNDPYLYIPTGSDYDDLLVILSQKHIAKTVADFDWVARKMNLPAHVYPGKYRIYSDMSNYELAKMLRSGEQEPVKLVITKFRLKEDLVSFISKKLEADSATLFNALNDSVYLRKYHLNSEEAIVLFIPNTYEFLWNTDYSKVIERMNKEFQTFWNAARTEKAAGLKLTPLQVVALASIVEEETNYNPEKSRIAGVYLNRINRGMPLQADPTVKYALKNFSLRRVLNVHLTYESPYNTYLHTGLPPGPICTPSFASIDAVLNAERNDYLYFCADPDKAGTHAFARNLKEHQLNAKRYHQWLNRQ